MKPSTTTSKSLMTLALGAIGATAGWSGMTHADNVLMEEVIVTAQKREESNQNVPLTITALTAEAIEKRGIQNAHDIMLQTPGMGGFESPGSKGTIAV